MVQVAAGMVVATFVDLGQLHPLIALGIVALDSLRGLVDFLAGTGDDDVAVKDLSNRMAMARKLHPFPLSELKIVFRRISLGNDLSALEHAIGKGLEVSSSDHEYTWVSADSDLYHLEVVREIATELDELVLDITGRRVVGRNGLRVFLEDAESLRKFDPCSGLLLRSDTSVHLAHYSLTAVVSG